MPTITAATRRRRGASGILNRPNILFLVTDDQQPGTMTPDVMPYLMSNPFGNWVDFPNAVVSTPLCAISRATLFTGQRWMRHNVRDNSMANNLDETDTIAVALSAAGYRTGLIGKYENEWPYGGAPYIPQGWERFHGRTTESVGYYDWDAYTNIPGARTQFGSLPADYSTDYYSTLVNDFIRGADGRPWFLMVTPGAPHDEPTPPPRYASVPYTVADPPDFNLADVSGYPGHIRNRPLMDSTMQANARADWVKGRQTLRAVDDMVQTMMVALEQTGQLENTVVIYITDNAVMMGRKRWSIHNTPGGFEKKLPYQGDTDLLMRVRYPGATQRSEAAPVASVDLPNSFLAWAGTSFVHTVDGSRRLAEVITDAPTAKRRPSVEIVFPESGGITTWYALKTAAGLKYHEYWFGTNKGTVLPGSEGALHEVFDLTTDPYEMTNLYGGNSARDTALKAELHRHLDTPMFWEA